MTALLPLLGIISHAVLVLLVLLSIWSVAIMLDRWKRFSKIAKESELEALKAKLRAGGSFSEIEKIAGASRDEIRAGVLRAALSVGPQAGSEQIDRAVRNYLGEQRKALEGGIPVLATLGANAPFIGLFGTVLGIIQAFGSLATQSVGSASVISGVAEALIATAVGLLVAIPAVVAYNSFTRRVRLTLQECEQLRDLFVAYRKGV